MKPSTNALVEMDFDVNDLKVLEELLKSPTLRAYLRSTFVQLRDSTLVAQEPPFTPIPNAGERLAFVAGAEELLTQCLRIGD